MNSSMRRGSPWLLPFLITGGMTFGAFIGMSIVWRATAKPGATSDWEAVLQGVSLLIVIPGFAWSVFTMLAARALRRAAYDRFPLRLALSIASGAGVGTLAEFGVYAEMLGGLLFFGSVAVLGWSWAGPTAADPEPGPDPGSRGRWRAAWLLPFLISGGTAFGAMVGFTLVVGDVMLQEGSTGDLMGAAGALLLLLSLGATFALSSVTILLANLLGRDAPGRFGLRILLSLGSGGVIGALSSDQRDAAQLLSVLLLLSAAALLSWSWRGKRALPDAEAASAPGRDHARRP